MLLLPAAACRRDTAVASTAPARPPAPVTVAAAITQDVPVYLDEIGRCIPVETVSIVPQVGGRIVSAPIDDGAYVKKDQVLFEIDARPYRAALDSARANLDWSKADRELAAIEFKRVQDLKTSQNASDLEFDQRRIALSVADARIEAATAALEMARINLDYTRILAPLDGRAGAKLIHAGNVVRENDAPLMTIDRLDPIYAEFTITENDLGSVRKYMATAGLDWGDAPEKNLRVQVDIPGDSPRVRAALGTAPATQPGRNRAGPRSGKLTFLDNSVQMTTGVVKLRATLDNPDHYFWPGQFVNVRLILTIRKNAVLIPAAARQIGQQGPYVYIVDAGQKAQLRPIQPGQPQGDLLVVEQGVEAGESVIVTGHLSIMPGGPVAIMGSPQ